MYRGPRGQYILVKRILVEMPETCRTGSAGRYGLSAYDHVPGNDDPFLFDIACSLRIACSDVNGSQVQDLPVRQFVATSATATDGGIIVA